MKHNDSKQLLAYLSKISDECLQKYTQILNLQLRLSKLDNKKLRKCKKIACTELHIYFTFITDLALSCEQSPQREDILKDIFKKFYDKSFKSLLTPRCEFYYNESTLDNSNIPHFWLSPDFDTSQLDGISKTALLFTDIIFQDTVLGEFASLNNLYDLHIEYLGLFSATLIELFTLIRRFAYEVFNNFCK